MLIVVVWSQILSEAFGINQIALRVNEFLTNLSNIADASSKVFPVVFDIKFLNYNVEVKPNVSIFNFLKRVQLVVVSSSICMNL